MDGNEQKVGFAEKKLRLTQKMAHRVYQGEMGGAVGLQEGKFCITIQKLYCFVSLFQKNILILLLHVCGKRLKRQGSDCTAGGRMRRNFSDYFRCIRLTTNDLPTKKFYYCEE